MTNNLHQALQSHQAADIFSTNKNLNKAVPKCFVKYNKSNKTKFIPRNMQVKIESKSVLGDLYMVPDLELIDTFQSNIRSVTKILSCSDNTAFIGSSLSEKLQKIKFENLEIKIDQEIKIKVNDMSWTQDGEILVSLEESDIKLYTKDNKLKIVKSFSPFNTPCVHVTKDTRIIVGLTESLHLLLTESIRRLVIVNQDGEIQHTIEFDRE